MLPASYWTMTSQNLVHWMHSDKHLRFAQHSRFEPRLFNDDEVIVEKHALTLTFGFFCRAVKNLVNDFDSVNRWDKI